MNPSTRSKFWCRHKTLQPLSRSVLPDHLDGSTSSVQTPNSTTPDNVASPMSVTPSEGPVLKAWKADSNTNAWFTDSTLEKKKNSKANNRGDQNSGGSEERGTQLIHAIFRPGTTQNTFGGAYLETISQKNEEEEEKSTMPDLEVTIQRSQHRLDNNDGLHAHAHGRKVFAEESWPSPVPHLFHDPHNFHEAMVLNTKYPLRPSLKFPWDKDGHIKRVLNRPGKFWTQIPPKEYIPIPPMSNLPWYPQLPLPQPWGVAPPLPPILENKISDHNVGSGRVTT